MWFPGKALGGKTLAAQSVCYCYNGSLKNKCWMPFSLLTFLHDSKNTQDFFPCNKSRYKCRAFVKAKWHKDNFQKAEGNVCAKYKIIHGCLSLKSTSFVKINKNFNCILRTSKEYRFHTCLRIQFCSSSQTILSSCVFSEVFLF